MIITDGPPGVGCPVIASITGATVLLIVVEPSLSSLHDMKRVADLADHFSIPYLLCINKFDINQELTEAIQQEAARRNVEIAGYIPFDAAFTHAMVAGKNIVDYAGESALVKNLHSIWTNIITSTYLRAEGSQDFPIITSTY